MHRKHVVVLGGSFAGLTAALELKRQLGPRHDVTLISKAEQLLFKPALSRIPFGLQGNADVAHPIRSQLENHGIRFQHDEVIGLHLGTRSLLAKKGYEEYDFLVIATESKANYAAIPGLGPRGHTQSLTTLSEAERAGTAFAKFLEAPGPVVVGCAQGASCSGPPYEFLFNLAKELDEHDLQTSAPLTYLTAEPVLSSFNLGAFGSIPAWTEYLFERLGIRVVTKAAIQQVTRDEIWLIDGRRLTFTYAMVLPPSLGAKVVRACEDITDASGFVRVNGCYQSDAYPEVFAAGAAVAETNAARGLPRTRRSAEETGRIVAHNVVAAMLGERMVNLFPESGGQQSVLG